MTKTYLWLRCRAASHHQTLGGGCTHACGCGTIIICALDVTVQGTPIEGRLADRQRGRQGHRGVRLRRGLGNEVGGRHPGGSRDGGGLHSGALGEAKSMLGTAAGRRRSWARRRGRGIGGGGGRWIGIDPGNVPVVRHVPTETFTYLAPDQTRDR